MIKCLSIRKGLLAWLVGMTPLASQAQTMGVCHKSMAHPLLCYLLHNPRSIVAYSKKGIILYRLQILLFPIFSIINRQEVHKRA